jgi:hypothetical protein
MIQRKTLASNEASYSNDAAAKKKCRISQDINRARSSLVCKRGRCVSNDIAFGMVSEQNRVAPKFNPCFLFVPSLSSEVGTGLCDTWSLDLLVPRPHECLRGTNAEFVSDSHRYL